MNIRSKIILITLPLIITPLIITMIVAILSARNGITLVATEFLTFKTEVLTNYMNNQWNLLIDNELDKDEKFIRISKSAVENFSKTLIGNQSERIFAVNNTIDLTMTSSDIILYESDKTTLEKLINTEQTGWQNLNIGGIEVIADTSFFKPFDWYILVTVERKAFYGEITNIIFRTLLIFVISLLLAVVLLFIFSSYLTKPLENIVDAIRKIITTSDLSTKVTLQYKDETGKLGHYFNIMTGELDNANNQMKSFALQAVVAKRKESKIRNIFQKYVPKNVIDKFFSDPESMLEGDNRVLGILFSDIRSFTSFSEKLPPYEVVESLNKYFEYMVDIITDHGGIVDKYIGDAIMAFFGAPVHHDNDALQSVLAGLEMIEQLKDFNQWQTKYGRDHFNIGVGINYGIVTVGNIGSEKKMDYTVIGDMVNLASRLEGLTKLYKEPLIISESIFLKISNMLPCRLIDKVIVKGKTKSGNIYTVKKVLSLHEEKAWGFHEIGVEHYYNRDFQIALDNFHKTSSLLPHDHCSKLFIERCEKYIKKPPAPDWTGDTVLSRK